jgi:serine/threonine protein kinase/Flp pilus assembly protein TadD
MDSSSSGKYALLDQIAEEFAERRRHGEAPTLREYVEKYPHLAADLRDILPAMAEIEQVKVHVQESFPAEVKVETPPLRQVGDYRILRQIGRGGMGVVYEAEQQSLGRRVALKVLPAHTLKDAKALERFRREARAAAKLHHTNIVPVFEVDQDGDLCFYAMQFIQGQALDQIIDELRRLREHSQAVPTQAQGAAARSLLTGVYKALELTEGYVPTEERPPSDVATPSGETPLSGAGSDHPHYFRSVAHIGQQVAQALAYAHARHIIHRDIKPSNLLLDAAGVVWVTDFGLAKTDDDGLTNTGDIVGTLRYMAPERFNGHGNARADVYALGLTLYELLTLQPAFAARDRLKLIEQIRTTEPARPRTVDRRIPRDLETIVLKAMDKDATRRYQTAEELAQDLGRFLDDEPIHARSASLAERGWRWARRRPAVAGLFAATTVAALAHIAVAVVLFYNQRLENLYEIASKARDEADISRKEAIQARDKEIRLRGLLAVRTGHVAQAIDDLTRVAAVFPDDREVWIGLGQAYAGSQQTQEALDAFSRALALNPEDSEARVGRAGQYALLRRHKEAVADYAVAFRVNPDLGDHAAAYARSLYEDAAWTDLEIVEMKSAGGATLTCQPDNSILASGNNPDEDVYTIVARCPLPKIAVLRLEILSDPSYSGWGRNNDGIGGIFFLSEFRVSAAPAAAPDGARATPFAFAWSPNRSAWGRVQQTIDGDRSTGWSVLATERVRQIGGELADPTALFFFQEPIAQPGGAQVTVQLDFPILNQAKHMALGRFRLSAASRTDLIAFESLLARPGLNAWMKLAAAHCLRGDGAAALRALNNAHGHEVGLSFEYHLLMAIAYFQCQQPQEGRDLLAIWLSNIPEIPEDDSIRGLAVVALSKQLEIEPFNVELWLQRGRCYRQMKWLSKAVADFRQAHELKPNDATSLLECGECRIALGDADNAGADFDAAISVNAEQARTFLRSHQYRPPQLEKDFEGGMVYQIALARAERGTDHERTALLDLALMQAETTHYPEAIAALDRMLELKADDAQAVDLLLRVLRARAEASALQGKPDEAAQDWRRLRQILEKRLVISSPSAKDADLLASALLAERCRWNVVRPLEGKANSGDAVTLLPDGSILSVSPHRGKEVYTVTADMDWTKVLGVKLEFLGHPRLPNGGPSRGVNGFVLAEFGIKVPPNAPEMFLREPVTSKNMYRLSGDPSGHDGPLFSGYNRTSPIYAIYQMPPFPAHAKGKTLLRIRCDTNANVTGGDIGRFRLATTTDPQTILALQLQAVPMDGWLKLAAAHALHGDREAALAALRKFTKTGDAFEEMILAWIHLQAGSSEEARYAVGRATYRMQTLPFPRDSQAAFALTDLVFQMALTAWPEDRDLQLHRALFRLTTGKEKEALAEITKVIEQTADSSTWLLTSYARPALTVRLYAATPGGVTKVNRDSLLQLSKKAGDAEQPLLTAAVQLRAGNAEETARIYKEQATLDTPDLLLSALAYRQLGKTAEAKKQLEEANERMKQHRAAFREAQEGKGKQPMFLAEWAVLLLLQREAEGAINGAKK